MHQEVLTKSQLELLPFVSSFSRDFYLAGGTAIALTIGHRRSIDFDLFSVKPIDPLRIKNQFRLKQIFELPVVEDKAAELFPEAFSAKLLRQQLAYFTDIDYSEKVNYLNENPADENIREYLINQAIRTF